MQSILAQDRRAALLREFEDSGLSMAEFCRRREVGYKAMAAWRRNVPRQPTVTFIEVEAIKGHGGGAEAEAEAEAEACSPSAGCLSAELLLLGGVRLRVHQMPSTGGVA
jgi:hypothetical protein